MIRNTFGHLEKRRYEILIFKFLAFLQFCIPLYFAIIGLLLHIETVTEKLLSAVKAKGFAIILCKQLTRLKRRNEETITHAMLS